MGSAVLTPTYALTDEEIFREFRFNFLSPGARALGLGGAFVAAGDDAAAAESNPAALHYVNRYEIFAEYRSIESDDVRFSAGGTPADLTLPAQLPFVGINTQTTIEDSNLFSFGSVVIPLRPRRLRIALSRQVVLDAENVLPESSERFDGGAFANNRLEFASTDFPTFVCTENCLPGNDPPAVNQYTIQNTVDGQLDAEIVNTNLAFSVQAARNFSVGLTATQSELDIQSQIFNRTTDGLGILGEFNPRIDANNDGLFDPFTTATQINDSDTSLAYTVGLHWHPDTAFPGDVSNYRFGAVFRKGAEFEVDQCINIDVPAENEDVIPMGACGALMNGDRITNTIRVPDRYSIGFSFHDQRHWVVAVDIEQIEYSDLLEGFQPGVNFFTSEAIPTDFLRRSDEPLVFDVDDAMIFRLGVEYGVPVSGWEFFFRAGFFNDPDNRIRLEEFPIEEGLDPQELEIAQEFEEIYKSAFRAGDDVNHVTGGLSIATPIGLRLDLAADIADDGNQYLASLIWRFGDPR